MNPDSGLGEHVWNEYAREAPTAETLVQERQ